MRDVRDILLKSLVPALKTATGKSVYTRIPKSAEVTYPYIYISDIYQQEIGPKTSFQYQMDVLIQVMHKNETSLSDLFTDIDNVLSVVNNGSPFALESPFEIQQCTLNNSTTTEIQTETGTVNVGVIRLFFLIDN